MPHVFINRIRIHDLTRARSDLRAQFRWEAINAVFYKVGGLLEIEHGMHTTIREKRKR